MLGCDREIKEAAAVEIGILQSADITTEQTIEAIHCWEFGTDVGISAGQIFLKPWGRNPWSGKFHTGRGASRLGASRGHGVEHTGPGVMGVTGQVDQPLAEAEGALQDRLPLYAVAIPGVEVVGDLAGF